MKSLKLFFQHLWDYLGRVSRVPFKRRIVHGVVPTWVDEYGNPNNLSPARYLDETKDYRHILDSDSLDLFVRIYGRVKWINSEGRYAQLDDIMDLPKKVNSLIDMTKEDMILFLNAPQIERFFKSDYDLDSESFGNLYVRDTMGAIREFPPINETV